MSRTNARALAHPTPTLTPRTLQPNPQEVDAAAKKEKARRPGTFPYFLSVNLEHMGMLTLTYVTNQNPHHEYIVVTHKGLTYRRKNFSSPDKLIAYFKKHYMDVRSSYIYTTPFCS